MMYYLYSLKHSGADTHLWWRPDSAGYTQEIRDAGLYSETEALGIQGEDMDTVAVPEERMKEFSQFHVIPMDRSDNASILRELIARTPHAVAIQAAYDAGKPIERREKGHWYLVMPKGHAFDFANHVRPYRIRPDSPGSADPEIIAYRSCAQWDPKVYSKGTVRGENVSTDQHPSQELADQMIIKLSRDGWLHDHEQVYPLRVWTEPVYKEAKHPSSTPA